MQVRVGFNEYLDFCAVALRDEAADTIGVRTVFASILLLSVLIASNIDGPAGRYRLRKITAASPIFAEPTRPTLSGFDEVVHRGVLFQLTARAGSGFVLARSSPVFRGN